VLAAITGRGPLVAPPRPWQMPPLSAPPMAVGTRAQAPEAAEDSEKEQEQMPAVSQKRK